MSPKLVLYCYCTCTSTTTLRNDKTVNQFHQGYETENNIRRHDISKTTKLQPQFCIFTMASRYKMFLRLCSEWPVDISKTDRDLGSYIRKVVGERFKLGEASQIDEKECKRQYNALQKINTDYYKMKYEITLRRGCTGLSADELHEHLSTKSMEEMSRDEGIFTRMKKSLE
ncbi:MNF1 [Mytilus coruscus]|uniref:Mitochondrial nucleoid factor 1 n=1 Tax=Mytilus coruscus TaxID=42192 RepID=A0A6J8BIG9_MYTCO|nr:MNF1 [Mytilus coruscus]